MQWNSCLIIIQKELFEGFYLSINVIYAIPRGNRNIWRHHADCCIYRWNTIVYVGKCAKGGNTLNSNLDHNKKCINFSKCMRTVENLAPRESAKLGIPFCGCSSAMANGTIEHTYSIFILLSSCTLDNGKHVLFKSLHFQFIRRNGYVKGTHSIEITTKKPEKSFNVFSSESLSIAFFVSLSHYSFHFFDLPLVVFPLLQTNHPPSTCN